MQLLTQQRKRTRAPKPQLDAPTAATVYARLTRGAAQLHPQASISNVHKHPSVWIIIFFIMQPWWPVAAAALLLLPLPHPPPAAEAAAGPQPATLPPRLQRR